MNCTIISEVSFKSSASSDNFIKKTSLIEVCTVDCWVVDWWNLIYTVSNLGLLFPHSEQYHCCTFLLCLNPFSEQKVDHIVLIKLKKSMYEVCTKTYWHFINYFFYTALLTDLYLIWTHTVHYCINTSTFFMLASCTVFSI